jgi:hypothetical protein
MIRRGVVPWATGHGVGVLLLLLLLALGTGACGGAGPNAAAEGVVRWSPTTAPSVAASGRLTVGEQLVLLDAPQPPHAYDDVLTRLTARCRESRAELAAALVVARHTLEQERGVAVTVLDYLGGVDRVVPAGSQAVDCTAIATELGRTIGR